MGLLEAAPPPKPVAQCPERASAPANAGGRVPKGAGRQARAGSAPANAGGRDSCERGLLKRSNCFAALAERGCREGSLSLL
eukprot:10258344-Alexandrium_andersonii.AAC.1